MADVVEVELSYLAARLPDLAGCKSSELRDVYFPAGSLHAKLRIRQKNDEYELTKKTVLDPNDTGIQKEETIVLSKEEFDALAQGAGRELAKTRYYLPYDGLTAEIDVFGGELKGLVIIDFEFGNTQEKDAFVKPDFCLADVTQEEFVAGGILAGKAYGDIRGELERFHYRPL